MKRLVVVDWLRTFAILAMAAFHFGRDFEILGLVPPGTTFGGAWELSARTIAGSFLFLAGFSIWLAHGRRFRPVSWVRRLLVLAAAAAGVSAATYVAVPEAWVRFGILHAIALASVMTVLFLRAPWWLTAAAGCAVLFAAPMLRDPSFDGVWWLWSGLGTRPPAMMDYEPMVPWLAPCLAGLAFGQAGGARLLAWGPSRPGRFGELIAWPGRHALPIYLIHQPALIALLWTGAWVSARL